MRFVPIFDRLVLEVKETNKTLGGIVLPDDVNVELCTAIVLATGPGPIMSTGQRGEMPIAVGDEILFDKSNLESVTIEGNKFDTLNLRAVFGIIKR